ncbi:MAG: hypothetical protein GXP44_02020 [bacterium]|nr:hypothetical protein [bacterium]
MILFSVAPCEDSQIRVLRVRRRGAIGKVKSATTTAFDAANRVTQLANSANRAYFVYNAVGGVVAMTDSAAAVTSTSDYEVFGKVVRTTGSTTENRKFCTKERDTSIGLDNFGFHVPP